MRDTLRLQALARCGGNTTVGQSLAESDAILASPSRNFETCSHAKCLDEEINTGRALELNSGFPGPGAPGLSEAGR